MKWQCHLSLDPSQFKLLDPRGALGFWILINFLFPFTYPLVYLADADANIFVAVMIETTEALADIDAICATPGLDCVVIGTNDLSGAMGLPYMGSHPRVQSGVDDILAAAKRHGKHVFFSTRDAKLASLLAAKGVEILHVGSDCLAAVSYQTNLVKEIKEGVGK